jgi:hypothetical protein
MLSHRHPGEAFPIRLKKISTIMKGTLPTNVKAVASSVVYWAGAGKSGRRFNTEIQYNAGVIDKRGIMRRIQFIL